MIGGVAPDGNLLENGLRNRGDLRLRRVDVDVRLEEDFDDAGSGQRLRLDVLDVVDRRRQRALVGSDDAARHVVRRQAGIAPDRRNDGNADIGKNVGRRPQRRERPENQDEDRHHDEGVGSREREPNDGCHGHRTCDMNRCALFALEANGRNAVAQRAVNARKDISDYRARRTDQIILISQWEAGFHTFYGGVVLVVHDSVTEDFK